jgi:hypothetical protein
MPYNIPDNQFRSRDPKFAGYKTTHSMHPATTTTESIAETLIPASEFSFDPTSKTCVCPAGEDMWLRSERDDLNGNSKLF